MVEDLTGVVVVGVGFANNTDEGEVLVVGAVADGEGDDARTNALGPHIAVGDIASVELVAAADEVDVWLRDEGGHWRVRERRLWAES